MRFLTSGARTGGAGSGVLERTAWMLGQGWRTWRRRAALEAALWRLEDSALDDIGIRRDEIALYARVHPTAARLLSSMLMSLGIGEDWVKARTPVWGDLQKGCLHCPNKGVCARWLRSGKPWDGYRAFCWNAATLDLLPRAAGKPVDALRG